MPVQSDYQQLARSGATRLPRDSDPLLQFFHSKRITLNSLSNKNRIVVVPYATARVSQITYIFENDTSQKFFIDNLTQKF